MANPDSQALAPQGAPAEAGDYLAPNPDLPHRGPGFYVSSSTLRGGNILFMSRNLVIVGGAIADRCAGVYARKCGYDSTAFEMGSSAGGPAMSWKRGGMPFRPSGS